MGSQHILLHLNDGIAFDFQRSPHCIFRTTPVHLEGIDWTIERCNPILAMLILSDTPDLTCLSFSGVDLECARRILEIVKAVKTQPVEFLGLLLDVTWEMWSSSPTDLALLLESIKQAMAFIDEESITSFLRPMAEDLQMLLRWADALRNDNALRGETERICHLLQAKYAASLISSSSQLRLLSCVRSGAVARPAVGWRRMHEPL
jgi:hypothetical protein